MDYKEGYVPLEEVATFKRRTKRNEVINTIGNSLTKSAKFTGDVVSQSIGGFRKFGQRVKMAKERSGLGVHKVGKGESFGFGTRNVGIKFNQADPFGYKPPQKEKPKIKYRTKYITKTKYVYKKRR